MVVVKINEQRLNAIFVCRTKGVGLSIRNACDAKRMIDNSFHIIISFGSKYIEKMVIEFENSWRLQLMFIIYLMRYFVGNPTRIEKR